MKTITMILLALSSVALAGCGGDGRGGGEGEEDPGTAEDPGDDDQDPFTAYDCSGGGDACNQAICSTRQGYEQALTSCESSGAACDVYRECVTDYVVCFEDACPDVESMDAQALGACGTTYSSCVTGAL